MDEPSPCRVPKQPILQTTGNAQGRRACAMLRAKSETDTDDQWQVPKHVHSTAASEEATQADD